MQKVENMKRLAQGHTGMFGMEARHPALTQQGVGSFHKACDVTETVEAEDLLSCF